MKRLQRVENQAELERLIDDFSVRGYKIKEQKDKKALLKRKDWGDGGLHLIIFALFGWWTLGIANLIYATYTYSVSEEVLIVASEEPRNPNNITTYIHQLYETSVSKNWHYAIVIPSLLTIPSYGIFFIDPSESYYILIVFSRIVSVIVPLFGLFFDRKYIRANSLWEPSYLWMLFFLVLNLFNIFLCVVYLYKRHENLGVQ